MRIKQLPIHTREWRDCLWCRRPGPVRLATMYLSSQPLQVTDR